jgi:hypothetical protein
VTTNLGQRKHIFRHTSNFFCSFLQDVPAQHTSAPFMRKKIKKSQKKGNIFVSFTTFYFKTGRKPKKVVFFCIFMSKHEEN